MAFRDCNNRADVLVHKIPFAVLAECVNKDYSNPEVVRAKRTRNAVFAIHAVPVNINPEDVKDHKILCVQVVENVHPANTLRDRVQEQTTQFVRDARTLVQLESVSLELAQSQLTQYAADVAHVILENI